MPEIKLVRRDPERVIAQLNTQLWFAKRGLDTVLAASDIKEAWTIAGEALGFIIEVEASYREGEQAMKGDNDPS